MKQDIHLIPPSILFQNQTRIKYINLKVLYIPTILSALSISFDVWIIILLDRGPKDPNNYGSSQNTQFPLLFLGRKRSCSLIINNDLQEAQIIWHPPKP